MKNGGSALIYEDLPDGAFYSRTPEPSGLPSDSSTWERNSEDTKIPGIEYIGSFTVIGADADTRADYVRRQLDDMRRKTTTKSVLLLVSLSGIKVCSPDGQKVYMAHALRRISYATCYPEHCQFSFLAREPKGHYNMQYCHCFFTQTAEQAQHLNSVVGQVFRVAYVQQMHDKTLKISDTVDKQAVDTSVKFLELGRKINKDSVNLVAADRTTPCKTPEHLLSNVKRWSLTDDNMNHWTKREPSEQSTAGRCDLNDTMSHKVFEPPASIKLTQEHMFQNCADQKLAAKENSVHSTVGNGHTKVTSVPKKSYLMAIHTKSTSLDSSESYVQSPSCISPPNVNFHSRSGSTDLDNSSSRVTSSRCYSRSSSADSGETFHKQVMQVMPHQGETSFENKEQRTSPGGNVYSYEVTHTSEGYRSKSPEVRPVQSHGRSRNWARNFMDRLKPKQYVPHSDVETSSVPGTLAPLPPSDSEPENEQLVDGQGSGLIGYEEPIKQTPKVVENENSVNSSQRSIKVVRQNNANKNNSTIVQTYSVSQSHGTDFLDSSMSLIHQPIMIQQAKDNPSYLREATTSPPICKGDILTEPSVFDDRQLREAWWFQAGIPREVALELLAKEPLGAFIVRGSTTQAGCYALSVRVPRDHSGSGIAHYLIMKKENGTYHIKGFPKEFPSLTALITHHSVLPELLPCPLLLSRSNPLYIHSDSAETVDSHEDSDYNRFSDFRHMMAELKLNEDLQQ